MMSKKELQKAIREGENFIISEHTLNLEFLLAVAYDIMDDFRLRTPLKRDILEVFEREDKSRPNQLSNEVYYGWAKLKEYRHGDIAFDPCMVWDDVCNYFDSIAPNGYYFGSHPGDGSCIGWHKCDEYTI